MMAVILSILKITGIVLLILLALIILILCYVVFAPFKYFLQGESYESVIESAEFRDFLGIIRIKQSFTQDNGLDFGVYLFGSKKPLFPKQEKEEPTGEISSEEAEEQTGGKKPEDGNNSRNAAESKTNEVTAEKQAEEASEKPEQNDSLENTPAPEKESKKKDLKNEEKKSKRNPDENASRASSNKLVSFIRLAGEERTHLAIRFLLEKVIQLIKVLLPQKMEADLTLSTGEPDVTGKLLGALSMCPVVYDKKVRIVPDFNENKPYAKGYIKLLGSIMLFKLLAIIISVILNKDCRKLWKELK
ncbi:MAG: hypothetical protein J6N76_08165 [Lachnospiraceae bacterium]|nr:hypothetical protein [Lachnospiraceae bacterium]